MVRKGREGKSGPIRSTGASLASLCLTDGAVTLQIAKEKMTTVAPSWRATRPFLHFVGCLYIRAVKNNVNLFKV